MSKTKCAAILLNAFGGPELLQMQNIPLPKVSGAQLRIRMATAGVNYYDTIVRRGEGNYAMKASLPLIPGREGAGIVDQAGPEASLKIGTRVCFINDGAYSEYVCVPENRVVPVPDGIDFVAASAALYQGLSAHYLAHSAHPLKPGDSVLIQGGSSGVAHFLIQMCKRRGADVIATVSKEEKAQRVLAAGADRVVMTTGDWLQEVHEMTDGQGVHVVYDGVGKALWPGSLKACAPLGNLLLYGHASGRVPAIDPVDLMNQGSVRLQRSSLNHYIATESALRARAYDLFTWIKKGKVKLPFVRTLPLSAACEAHRLIESREMAGKIVLIIDSRLK